MRRFSKKTFISLLAIISLVLGGTLGSFVYANEEDSQMIAVDSISSYHRKVRDVYVGDKVSSLVLPKEVTLVYGENWKRVYISWEPEISMNEFSSEGIFTKVCTVKYKMVLPEGYYIPEDKDLSSMTEITVNIKESIDGENQKYPYATVEDSMIKIYTSKYDSQIAYCYNQDLSRPSYRDNVPYSEGEDYVGQGNKDEHLIKSLIYIGYPFDGLGLRAKYNVTSNVEAYGETQTILWAMLRNSKPLFLSDYGNAVYEAVMSNQGVIPNRGEFSISETPKFTYIEDKDYYESQELQIIGYNGEVNLKLPEGVEIYKNNKKSSNIVSTRDRFTLRVPADLVKSDSKFIMSIDKYSYEYPERITYHKPEILNAYGIEYQNLLSFDSVWHTLEDERYFEINVETGSMEEIDKPVIEETPEVEEVPEVEETPEVEEVPEVEETPEVEEVPDTEEVPGTEEKPAEEENTNTEETLDKEEITDKREPSSDVSDNIGPKTGDSSILIYVGTTIMSIVLLLKFRRRYS